MPCANNKDADRPVHPGSLINVFVLHCIDNIMYTVAIIQNSKTQASVSEQAGLSLTCTA